MKTSHHLLFVSSVCCAVASTGLVLGCYATMTPASEEIVYAPPPPRVETYPVYVYGGEAHYYVEGRWYRQTPRGWGYYRSEPEHLRGHRPPPRTGEHHDGEHHDGQHHDGEHGDGQHH